MQTLLTLNKGQSILHNPLMTNIHEQEQRDAFAERLAEALKRAEIEGPLREMAEKMGLSKSYLGRLLKGEQWPGMNMSLSLARLTGVRHEWLMNGEPPMTRSKEKGTIDVSRLPEDVQEAIRLLIKPYE